MNRPAERSNGTEQMGDALQRSSKAMKGTEAEEHGDDRQRISRVLRRRDLQQRREVSTSEETRAKAME